MQEHFQKIAKFVTNIRLLLLTTLLLGTDISCMYEVHFWERWHFYTILKYQYVFEKKLIIYKGTQSMKKLRF